MRLQRVGFEVYRLEGYEVAKRFRDPRHLRQDGWDITAPDGTRHHVRLLKEAESWILGRLGEARASGRPPHTLVIVARDRQDLYESALRTADPGVTVLMDRRFRERRQGERRQNLSAPEPGRRRHQRRQRPEVEALLRSEGQAVVRVGDDPAVNS